jgi:hypothetical protein
VIPADATLAAAIRIDPADLFEAIGNIAGAISPFAKTMFDGGVEEVQKRLDMKLADIFKSVGDTWRIYNSPSEGGVVITGLTAVAAVRDSETLVRLSDKIQEMVAAEFEGATEPNEFGRVQSHFSVKKFEHNKHSIYFFNFVDDEVPVSPAWCVTDKELIVALYPSHVKAYLNRGSEFKPITSVKIVADTLAGEKPPTMLGYVDTREVAKLVYPLAQGFANVIAGEMQRHGVDIDMSAFPSAGAILPHLRPGVSTLSPTKDGIEITTRQTMPMALGVFQALPVILFGVARGEAVRPAPEFGDEGLRLEKFDFVPEGGGDGAGAAPAKRTVEQTLLRRALDYLPRLTN